MLKKRGGPSGRSRKCDDRWCGCFHGSKSIARPDGSFLRKAGKKRRGNDTSGISQANRNLCTAEKREKNNVVDYINYPKRIYPIGRLDKDSDGLILMSNQGELVNKIMRAGNMHEKEYIVTVNKPVTDSFLRGLAGGVPLVELNATTRKCKVWRIGKRQFGIILTQGLNRQIRRMCEYFGYRVEKLVRTRIMNIELGDLKAGTYREVTPQEYKELMRLVKDSSNTTVIHGRDGGDR